MADIASEHLEMLSLLEGCKDQGALTCRLAMAVFGKGSKASRATNRMHTLARRGLVRRHEANVERWIITDEGRALLSKA